VPEEFPLMAELLISDSPNRVLIGIVNLRKLLNQIDEVDEILIQKIIECFLRPVCQLLTM